MTDWTAGYVTEVGYTHGFYRELVPRMLGFAGLLQGMATPGLSAAPLRVLELGCGQGLSANLIAAANPEIEYTAVDFNPAHVAGAQALATAAGTPNLRFHEASFEAVANDASLGQFDMITLHGIYTWVSAENRAHIIRIAREKLKGGGLLYLSYNTHPGWTPVMPIRRMFTDAADSLPKAPIFERLEEGFRLYKRLAEVKARYLATPGLTQRMQRFESMQKNYVAHELLNGEWTIFHFAEVADDMAKAKLSYVGSAHVLDAINVVNLTEDQRKFLAEIRDPIRRESLRDLIVNQGFRRDIFVKGALPLGPVRTNETWLTIRFALSAKAADIPRAVKGSLGEAKLPPEIYDKVLERLDTGPKTGRELVEDPGIAALGWARLREVLAILVGQGRCHVVPPEKGEGERAKRCDALNGAILQRARDSMDLSFLASPVLGGGVAVDRISQLVLLAAREKQPDAARYVWGLLKAQGQKIVKDGKTLETDEENLAEVRDRVAKIQSGPGKVLSTLKVR